MILKFLSALSKWAWAEKREKLTWLRNVVVEIPKLAEKIAIPPSRCGKD